VAEGVAVPPEGVLSTVGASGSAATLAEEALANVEEALLAGQLQVVEA
jgi:hypothetical protein